MLYKSFFTVFLLFSISVFSQNDTPEMCKEYMDKGMQATEERNFPLAMELLLKAEYLAKKNKLYSRLWFIKNNIGLTYYNLANFGEALDYYIDALAITEKHPELKANSAVVLANIGLLYSKEGDTQNALSYLTKAYEISKTGPNKLTHKTIGLNVVHQYLNEKKVGEAKKVLLEIKAPIENSRMNYAWEITNARTYFIEGQVEKAEKMAEDLYPSDDDKSDSECYSCVAQLLIEIYEKRGKIDQVIDVALKAAKKSDQLDEKIEYYDVLSRLYEKNNDYILSLRYKDSVIATKNTLYRNINRDLFEINKVKLNVRQIQNELLITNERKQNERTFFITLVLIILLSGFVIYSAFRNKFIKQRQDRIIAENKQKISEFEVEGLKNNISQKNRELSTRALYMSGRNELIQDIINTLVEIKEVSQNKDMQNYIRNLKSYIKTDVDWNEFIKHFEQVNPEFINSLKGRFPDLSTNDIRFISYVYMNLSLKEISIIFNITYNAAKKRKQRIKEKLGIDKEDSLYDFLLTHVQDQ